MDAIGPDWARGRGYWDGYYKHAPPPVYGGTCFAPPVIDERWSAPLPPVFYGDKNYLEEQRKDDQEWRKELRERDKEVRERWREWYKH